MSAIISPDMDLRIVSAVRRTYQAIVDDVWPHTTPSSAEAREVVADSTHLESHGNDKGAGAVFRKSDPDIRDRLLKETFR